MLTDASKQTKFSHYNNIVYYFSGYAFNDPRVFSWYFHRHEKAHSRLITHRLYGTRYMKCDPQYNSLSRDGPRSFPRVRHCDNWTLNSCGSDSKHPRWYVASTLYDCLVDDMCFRSISIVDYICYTPKRFVEKMNLKSDLSLVMTDRRMGVNCPRFTWPYSHNYIKCGPTTR